VLALALVSEGRPAGAAAATQPAGTKQRAAAGKADRSTVARAPRSPRSGKQPTTVAEQDGPTTTPRPNAAVGADGQPDDTTAGADGIAIEPAKNSPEILNRSEMLSLVRKYSTEIAQALLDGEKDRELAVRERDSIRLACIQDRLSHMKKMKHLADERLAATERPTIRADELNLRHEFRGVELAHERVIELRRELKECVGESLQVTSPADSVPTSVEPPGSNTVIPPADRPPPASVYR